MILSWEITKAEKLMIFEKFSQELFPHYLHLLFLFPFKMFFLSEDFVGVFKKI